MGKPCVVSTMTNITFANILTHKKTIEELLLTQTNPNEALRKKINFERQSFDVRISQESNHSPLSTCHPTKYTLKYFLYIVALIGQDNWHNYYFFVKFY